MLYTVRVPASSANLGAGFDCLGVALGLWLEVSLHVAAQDRFSYQSQDGQPLPAEVGDSDNLIHRAFRHGCALAGCAAPPVHIHARNAIPLARGLGSSSAAIVAGLALADAQAGFVLGREKIFQAAAALEGHPDNVASAVFGGVSISVKLDSGSYLSRRLEAPPRWHWLVIIPETSLTTDQARRALPSHYPAADVCFNLSRTALWVVALQHADASLLAVASQDALHQPYRTAFVPSLEPAREALLAAGAAACYLSGAGPSLAAVIAEDSSLQACLNIAQAYGQPQLLPVVEGFTYGESRALTQSQFTQNR